MSCANSVLVRVLLFVIFESVTSLRTEKLLERTCKQEKSCVFVSSCETLNYDNFTSLSECAQISYFRSTLCNKTYAEPMVCCSRYASQTDAPAVCGVHPKKPSIIGGQNADIDEYPWMALLEYRNRSTSEITYDCAGSLINNRYVLTAAHCLTNELTQVHLGKYDRNASENCNNEVYAHATVTVGINDTIIHERYSGTTKDIGLIRLSRVVYYTHYIQPICLPWTLGLFVVPDAASLEIGGWGKGSKSSVKQKLYIPANDFNKCEETYRRENKIRIDDRHICAGGRSNEGACAGDSGGPLMMAEDEKYAIVGIISYGYNMCDLDKNATYPVICTKVSSFKSWIKSKINL